MRETHIFITVKLNNRGFFDFQVGPVRNQRLPDLKRYQNGELDLEELIKAYYSSLGFSESDVNRIIPKLDDTQLSSSLVILNPTENTFLYFIGNKVSRQELERLLYGLDFTQPVLEKIKGGKWPHKSPLPVKLSVEVSFSLKQDNFFQVDLGRFLELEVDEYEKGEMTICAQRIGGTPSDFQRIAVVTLFWRPPFPSSQTKRLLEPKVYEGIRSLLERDYTLANQIKLLMKNLPHNGQEWQIADWWIS